MIIEDEREDDVDYKYEQPKDNPELRPEEYQTRDSLLLQDFLRIHKEIEDKSSHEQLRNDLVEHLWSIHSSS